MKGIKKNPIFLSFTYFSSTFRLKKQCWCVNCWLSLVYKARLNKLSCLFEITTARSTKFDVLNSRSNSWLSMFLAMTGGYNLIQSFSSFQGFNDFHWFCSGSIDRTRKSKALASSTFDCRGEIALTRVMIWFQVIKLWLGIHFTLILKLELELFKCYIMLWN